MTFWKKIGIEENTLIDWEITPAATYGLFECRGDMDTVRSSGQRFYYFYIDNWEKPPQLCLMERGLRHARVLATVDAPRDMIDAAVKGQGRACKEQNYAIDGPVRRWLEKHVLAGRDLHLVEPMASPEQEGLLPETGLPASDEPLPALSRVTLPDSTKYVQEEEIAGLVGKGNYFERSINPGGRFSQYFTDNQDGETVIEQNSALIWMRSGSELMSYRKALSFCRDQNSRKCAGMNNWRLPTIEEALSLLVPEKNEAGFHLHPCFSEAQGYIFTSDRRRPGGHWFVDLRRATVFWAAGTPFAGGFVRPCATL